MIIIVFGLPGSGKSYFATRLAEKLSADYVSSDRLRKELISEPTYSFEEKQLIYEKISESLYSHANTVKPLVIDGTFYLQKSRHEFNEIAESIHENIYWIEVTADEDVVKNRLAKPRQYSDADFEVYQSIRKDYAPFTRGKCLHLKSTNDNIENMLHRAMEFLCRQEVK